MNQRQTSSDSAFLLRPSLFLLAVVAALLGGCQSSQPPLPLPLDLPPRSPGPPLLTNPAGGPPDGSTAKERMLPAGDSKGQRVALPADSLPPLPLPEAILVALQNN